MSPCAHRLSSLACRVSLLLAWTGSGNVIRHERSHKGERPYRCTFPSCTYASARSDDVVKHFRCGGGHASHERAVCMAVQGVVVVWRTGSGVGVCALVAWPCRLTSILCVAGNGSPIVVALAQTSLQAGDGAPWRAPRLLPLRLHVV